MPGPACRGPRRFCRGRDASGAASGDRAALCRGGLRPRAREEWQEIWANDCDLARSIIAMLVTSTFLVCYLEPACVGTWSCSHSRLTVVEPEAHIACAGGGGPRLPKGIAGEERTPTRPPRGAHGAQAPPTRLVTRRQALLGLLLHWGSSVGSGTGEAHVGFVGGRTVAP